MSTRSKSVEIAAVILLLCEVVFCQGFRHNNTKISATNNAPQTSPALAALVERIRLAQLATRNPPNYELVREYRISGEGYNSIQADVTATLDFSPARNTYTVEKHEGNPRGKEMVREIL